MMGIKEGTYCDQHHVIYGIAESPDGTPETNITLYISPGIEIRKNKEKRNDLISCTDSRHLLVLSWNAC